MIGRENINIRFFSNGQRRKLIFGKNQMKGTERQRIKKDRQSDIRSTLLKTSGQKGENGYQTKGKKSRRNETNIERQIFPFSFSDPF